MNEPMLTGLEHRLRGLGNCSAVRDRILSYRQETDNAILGRRRGPFPDAASTARVDMSFYDSAMAFEDPAPPPVFVNPRLGVGRVRPAYHVGER
jgi:hypothetical protein